MSVPTDPPAHVRADSPIAAQADFLAALLPDDADAFCNERVAEAIREWRIADATEWQRAKFRARFLRALNGRRGAQGQS